MSLATREIGTELTDDLNLATAEVGENLLEIGAINKWLGGHSASIAGVRKLLPATKAPFSLADFGSGGGDTLRAIWLAHAGRNPSLTGYDGNAYTANFARSITPLSMDITYENKNIFSKNVGSTQFDIIHCSLTCHHFTHQQLVTLFKQMYRQSKLGFVINDLHRHPLALAGIKLMNGLLIKTALGKHDGEQSVRRGFQKPELLAILNEAGIKNYELEWRWAFRWLLIVPKA